MVNLMYSLQHGLIYGAVITGYLLVMMITVDPIIWGYSDYPERVKHKVRAPSSDERKKALVVALPFFLFMLIYSIYSLLKLRTVGGIIPFLDAFVHLLVLAAFASFGDLVLIDWLVISKITPSFVIIEGSEAADYKDFSHHYIGHVYASFVIFFLCAFVAYIASIYSM